MLLHLQLGSYCKIQPDQREVDGMIETVCSNPRKTVTSTTCEDHGLLKVSAASKAVVAH